MRTSSPRRRNGFTLVEILVAIAILAILTSIAVPAAYYAYARAKRAAIKLEVTNLATAVEQFKQKYGDYPPDGLRVDIMNRSIRKMFPRILASEFVVLETAAGKTAPAIIPVVSRAEALVLFLGGLSDDPQKPFSGPGGPFLVTYNGTGGITSIQYNTDRNNAIFEFDPSRLTIDQSSGVTISNDEATFGSFTLGTAASGAEPPDAIPAYLVRNTRTPFVYFDSRTYSVPNPTDPATLAVYNKYAGSLISGVARPYKSNIVNSGAPASVATPMALERRIKYMNDKSFQIVTAGLDDNFGGVANPNGDGFEAVFQFPTGDPLPATMAEGRYDARNTFNAQLDNVTNFSETTLEDGLPN